MSKVTIKSMYGMARTVTITEDEIRVENFQFDGVDGEALNFRDVQDEIIEWIMQRIREAFLDSQSEEEL